MYGEKFDDDDDDGDRDPFAGRGHGVGSRGTQFGKLDKLWSRTADQ